MSGGSNRGYRIGGEVECVHDDLSYLGQMGRTSMYVCGRCGGVLTRRTA
ncbi:hypothetical protein [Salinigranum rubrum]|nr:hypothetical protein [Salinigranum rubrum]